MTLDSTLIKLYINKCFGLINDSVLVKLIAPFILKADI